LENHDIEIANVENLQPDEEILKNFRRFFKKNVFSSVLNKLRN